MDHMAATPSEALQQKVLDVINGAFDETASAHEALRCQVQNKIGSILVQYYDPSHPKVETPARRPETSLSLPPQHQLALQLSRSLNLAMGSVGKSSRDERPTQTTLASEGTADPNDVVLQTNQKVPSAAKDNIDHHHACQENWTNNEYVGERSRGCQQSQNGMRSLDRTYFECSSVEGNHVASAAIPESVDFGDDVNTQIRNLQKADSRRFQTWSSASLSSCSNLGERVFLRCRGRFSNAASVKELPRWLRLAELILHSDSLRTSNLHPAWATATRGDGLSFQNVVGEISELVLSNQLVVKLESNYRRVQRNSLLSHGSVNTLSAATGCVVEACSNAGRGCQRIVHAVPLHPGRGPRLFWDTICVAICLYDLVFLPTAAFDFDTNTQAMKDSMDYCGAIFWSLDILLSFFTAYYDGYTIQRNYQKIAISYCRTWFGVDVAIVVNDWLFVMASKGSFGALRFMKWLKFALRCVRLLRLKKVSAHYRMAIQTVNSEMVLAVVKIVTQTFIVAIVCHYVACGWYAMHDIGGSDSTWVHKYIPTEASNAYRYTTCLHWALTQLLPASINVQPVNVPERVYNICVIIVSMVMFSSFISSISVSMNHLRSCRIAAIERDGQLRRFLSQHEISKELSHSIWNVLKAMQRARAQADIKPGEVLALKKCPEHILDRVYQESFLNHLTRHPLFDFYNMIEPNCMTKLCRNGLESQCLVSREVLWHDLVVQGMLFVKRGTLLYDEAITDPIIVEPGGWCCEEALWGSTPRIDVPFLAGPTGCEMLTVIPEVFRTVAKSLHQNESSYAFLAKYAEEFVRRFNEASHDNSCTSLLFNDKEVSVGILRDVIGSFQSSSKIKLSSSNLA